jgi:hypothetical protein
MLDIVLNNRRDKYALLLALWSNLTNISVKTLNKFLNAEVEEARLLETAKKMAKEMKEH